MNNIHPTFENIFENHFHFHPLMDRETFIKQITSQLLTGDCYPFSSEHIKEAMANAYANEKPSTLSFNAKTTVLAYWTSQANKKAKEAWEKKNPINTNTPSHVKACVEDSSFSPENITNAFDNAELSCLEKLSSYLYDGNYEEAGRALSTFLKNAF